MEAASRATAILEVTPVNIPVAINVAEQILPQISRIGMVEILLLFSSNLAPDTELPG
jgi:hypothetical protein